MYDAERYSLFNTWWNLNCSRCMRANDDTVIASTIFCVCTGGRRGDPGLLERGLISIQRCGGHFVSFSLNIPRKWNNLVSLRPNYFIIIGYLKTEMGMGFKWTLWTPSWTATGRNVLYICGKLKLSAWNLVLYAEIDTTLFRRLVPAWIWNPPYNHFWQNIK